ncbi:hypothetical protein GUJ93_ZPchr0002g23484 [Zizania palustris]|uniref:No apical meristem-associated C-terminal domain-containing protein n=1 Tax=Zizania palustris TaxID=103762 RepID=A0A8J5VUS2_ZIZPA|nr:hypothetical protein GUJ93_ZPchr0002g23484 [Zizania palustris]
MQQTNDLLLPLEAEAMHDTSVAARAALPQAVAAMQSQRRGNTVCLHRSCSPSRCRLQIFVLLPQSRQLPALIWASTTFSSTATGVGRRPPGVRRFVRAVAAKKRKGKGGEAGERVDNHSFALKSYEASVNFCVGGSDDWAYRLVASLRHLGSNEDGENVQIDDAVKIYEKDEPFLFMHCWKLLRNEAKWNDKQLNDRNEKSEVKQEQQMEKILILKGNKMKLGEKMYDLHKHDMEVRTKLKEEQLSLTKKHIEVREKQSEAQLLTVVVGIMGADLYKLAPQLKRLATYILSKGALLVLLIVLVLALGLLLVVTDGLHKKEFLNYARFVLWWVSLGVASSIGLGKCY